MHLAPRWSGPLSRAIELAIMWEIGQGKVRNRDIIARSKIGPRRNRRPRGSTVRLKAFVCFILIILGISAASAQQSPSLLGAFRSAGNKVDWPQFNFDAGHDGYNPYETILSAANVGSVTLKWSYPNAVAGQPVLVNGVVYFSTSSYFSSNSVYAVDAASGALIWKYDGIGPVFASPAVANGKVYVSDGDYMYAFDAATGAMVWGYDLPAGAQYCSPTVVDNVVYIGSDDHKVYAFNGTSGTILWTYTTAGSIYTTPAVANGLLYVSSGPGIVYALNAGTGALVWKKQFGSTIGPPKSLAGTQGGQAVANGVLYVEVQRSGPTYDLYALDAGTGALIWRAASVGYATPAIANGVVYAATGDQISALNAATGATIWQSQVYGAARSPVVANGVVYVGSWYLIGDESGDGTITALRASDGVSLWSQTVRGAFYDSGFPSPAVVNGTIYSPGLIGTFSLPNQ